MRRVFRYVVPADDQPHAFRLTGDPVAVATASEFELEFWAENDDTATARERWFTVVGTGHPLPEGGTYAGTGQRTRLGLVFHLYEVPGPATVSPGAEFALWGAAK